MLRTVGCGPSGFRTYNCSRADVSLVPMGSAHLISGTDAITFLNKTRIACRATLVRKNLPVGANAKRNRGEYSQTAVFKGPPISAVRCFALVPDWKKAVSGGTSDNQSIFTVCVDYCLIVDVAVFTTYSRVGGLLCEAGHDMR